MHENEGLWHHCKVCDEPLRNIAAARSEDSVATAGGKLVSVMQRTDLLLALELNYLLASELKACLPPWKTDLIESFAEDFSCTMLPNILLSTVLSESLAAGFACLPLPSKGTEKMIP
jgi:hypothetical protein